MHMNLIHQVELILEFMNKTIFDIPKDSLFYNYSKITNKRQMDIMENDLPGINSNTYWTTWVAQLRCSLMDSSLSTRSSLLGYRSTRSSLTFRKNSSSPFDKWSVIKIHHHHNHGVRSRKLAYNSYVLWWSWSWSLLMPLSQPYNQNHHHDLIIINQHHSLTKFIKHSYTNRSIWICLFFSCFLFALLVSFPQLLDDI